MNKRFWIICLVIGSGLLTLSVLGLSSLRMHRKGLMAERQQEFMAVARQISFDVKKKVDAFILQEQSRPYTDYQLYYVPESDNRAAALIQSPLANTYRNDFAIGYFQLDSSGQLVSPHMAQIQTQESYGVDHSEYFDNVKQNLLPSLQNGLVLAPHRVEPKEHEKKDEYAFDKRMRFTRRNFDPASANESIAKQEVQAVQRVVSEKESQVLKTQVAKAPTKSKGIRSRRSVYPISSLEESQQKTQILNQSRFNFEQNIASNTAVQGESLIQSPDMMMEQVPEEFQQTSSWAQSGPQQRPKQSEAKIEAMDTESDAVEIPITDTIQRTISQQSQVEQIRMADSIMIDSDNAKKLQQQVMAADDLTQTAVQDDTVQVRIEPFVPVTVTNNNGNGNGIFAGQVFLLRHVQIEDRHFVQGFQLNEDELLSQITQSARDLLRRGMGCEISKTEWPDAAFAAILQFDFGEIVLNLLEQEPGYIQAQVVRIRNWFFGILGVVWVSVLIAMAALWKNMRQQVLLSQKKDDFISAVSHELRTPLTSIRMYTEMLEKDWVKTDTKRREYYTTMRQESERLSRLIENVLDFSRIQRGKKKYDFTMGDVNQCIGEVADMLRPYAERAGFVLEQRFEVLASFAFDRDAVVQIVINLVDNALKYAKDAENKHIIIRTRKQKDYAIIEVEDHGPGIPRSQQKKIFDAFYRCEDESTRQSTGTGLGLALVRRFAEAHNGFVEIANTKPTGALFRVGLASQ